MVRLFCFPFAGGSARAYHSWRPLLDERIELVPLRPPGRESRHREPLPATLPDLLTDLAGQIVEHLEADGQDGYALYGHSFGGLLAYETARLLARRGHPAPLELFVGGCRPPQHGPRLAPVHTFPDQAFLGALAALGGVPEELLHDSDAVGYFAARIRNDYRLYETYRHTEPRQRLGCPVTVVIGEDDPVTSPADFDAWRLLTTGPVTAVELSGAGHFFLDTHAKELTGLVRGVLQPCPQRAAATVTGPALRDAMALLPTAVNVVSTVTEGRQRAFTAGSVCGLSLDPPLLLVCVGRDNSSHDDFVSARRFLVSVLDEEQDEAARAFAAPGLPRRAEELLVPGEQGLPGPARAVVRFACTRERVLSGGDHSILVGRIEEVAPGGAGGRPLIAFDRALRGLDTG